MARMSYLFDFLLGLIGGVLLLDGHWILGCVAVGAIFLHRYKVRG
jgi:hypothetical protein